MKLSMFLLLPALALAACATVPTPMSEALPTPSERIYFRVTEGRPTATVVFIRDRGFAGSGVYQHLLINEEKAASIDVGEKVTLQLLSGEYVFSVMPTDPFGGHAEFGIDQRLEAGRTYAYRILTDGTSFSTRIQRIIGKSVE